MDIAITVALSVIGVIIFLIGLIANCIFVAVIWKMKELHTPVFMILGNECISDVIFLYTSQFFAGGFMLERWVFGDAMCRMLGFLFEGCVTVSMFSLTLVAIERYFLICRTDGAKVKSKWSSKACIGIWVASAIVLSPLFYGYGVYENRSTLSMESTGSQNKTKIECRILNWPKSAQLAWHHIQILVTYLLPFAIIITAHSLIIWRLRQSHATALRLEAARGVTSSTPREEETATTSKMVRDREDIKSARKTARNLKIIKLLVCITVVFFFCYTPGTIFRIVDMYFDIPDSVRFVTTGVVWPILVVSTIPNFFITYKMSSKFRRALKMSVASERSV